MTDKVVDFSKDYSKIKDDISTLKNDVSGLLKLFERQGVEHVKSAIGDVKDSVKAHCDLSKMEDCIKKNPKESIFFAVTAGLILALFLSKK